MNGASQSAPASAGEGAGLAGSAVELAGYIADMAEQMEQLARGAKLERLSELLCLVRKEADRAAGV